MGEDARQHEEDKLFLLNNFGDELAQQLGLL